MKIVTPEEAVSVIGSRQQVYLHCAAAAPSVLLDALVARAPRGPDRDQRRPPPHRGPRPAPGTRDGQAFPPPGAVHRAERPGGGERGPGRLRAGLPVRRPASVPIRGACRSTPCSSTRRRPTPTASARSAPRSRRCTPRSAPRGRSSSSSTARCRGRWATASSTSTTSTWRSRSTCRRTSARSAIGDVERRIGELRRRARPGRRDAAAGHRGDPGGDRAVPARQAATSASTPRCSPTRSSIWSRPARSPARARSATGARS